MINYNTRIGTYFYFYSSRSYYIYFTYKLQLYKSQLYFSFYRSTLIGVIVCYLFICIILEYCVRDVDCY